MRFIRRAVRSKQFALIFANCSVLTEQNGYIDELSHRSLEADITLVNIELWREMPIKNLREVIAEHLNREFPGGLPDRLAIQVSGLELSILLDADERFPAVLQTLNLGREGYRVELPYPLLIWLPDYAYIKLARVAPDFWSVRRGSYPFLSDKKVDRFDDLDQVIGEGKDITLWQDKMGQIPLLERILEGIEAPPPETETDLKLKLGDAYRFIGRMENARPYYEEALRLSREELGDTDREGSALNGIGLVHTEEENFSEASDYLTQYVELREKQGKREGQAVGYNHLGLVYDKQGDYDQAIEYYQQALQINSDFGKREAEGEVLGNLGLAYRKAKRSEEAIKAHEGALGISREMNDPQSEAKDLSNIGLVHHEVGNYKSAIEYYHQALQLSQQSGNRRDELDQRVNLGDAWRDLGDFDETRGCYLEAYDIAQEIGIDELAVLERLSDLYGPKGLGDEEWEIHWTAELVRRSEELEAWESQLRHIRKLTEIYRREGERHATHGCLIDAEKILQKLLTQSAEAENAIRYCENLIGIYSGLNLDEKVKEHQQKLEALKESRRIHIWLPPGVVEVEDGRPVLRAGQPYTFYVQIGSPPTEYAWMEGADFRYAET